MSQFDAYNELLGIPPAEQPPTHYRLLGLSPFESNLSVIERAADRQMKHLREFKSGAHSAGSQRLLNEVAKARRVLLNDLERAAYDEQLRANSSAQKDTAFPATSDHRAWLQTSSGHVAASAFPVIPGRSIGHHKPFNSLLVVSVIVALVVCSAGVFVYAWSTQDRPVGKEPIAKSSPKKSGRTEARRESTDIPTPFMGNLDKAFPERPAVSPPTILPMEQPSTGPQAGTVGMGLKGSWSFDEPSGEIVADGSGNGSTGTLFGDIERIAGRQGQALHFNGLDAFVNLGRPASLLIRGSYKPAFPGRTALNR